MPPPPTIGSCCGGATTGALLDLSLICSSAVLISVDNCTSFVCVLSLYIHERLMRDCRIPRMSEADCNKYSLLLVFGNGTSVGKILLYHNRKWIMFHESRTSHIDNVPSMVQCTMLRVNDS